MPLKKAPRADAPLLYFYDWFTLVYTTSGYPMQSPLDDSWLIPGNSTTIAPPSTGEGELAQWDPAAGNWKVITRYTQNYYLFDAETGVYTTSGSMELWPFETPVETVDLDSGLTTLTPPAVGQYEIPVFDTTGASGWLVVDDYRGTWWDKTTADIHTIYDLEVQPDPNWTDVSPAGIEYPLWDEGNNQWIEDPDKINQDDEALQVIQNGPFVGTYDEIDTWLSTADQATVNTELSHNVSAIIKKLDLALPGVFSKKKEGK